MTLATYCDTSGTPNKSPVIVTVGFVASEREWTVLEVRWKHILAKYGITYHQSRQLEQLRGEFEKWSKDGAAGQKYRGALLHIGQSPRLPRAFASVLLRSKYRELKKKYALRAAGYSHFSLCASHCINQARAWIGAKSPSESVLYFHESEGRAAENSLVRVLNLDAIHVSFLPKQPTPGEYFVPFQLADLAAWPIRRFFEEKITGISAPSRLGDARDYYLEVRSALNVTATMFGDLDMRRLVQAGRVKRR